MIDLDLGFLACAVCFVGLLLLLLLTGIVYERDKDRRG